MDMNLDIKLLGDNSLLGKFITFCLKNDIDHMEAHNIVFDVKTIVSGVDINQQQILFKLMFPNSTIKVNVEHHGWYRVRQQLYDIAIKQDLFSSVKQEDIDWVINQLADKFYSPQEK